MVGGSRHLSRQAGVTVLEALVGAALLAMALMSQTSLLVANTKLSEQAQARSDTFVATREFMERLRAYDDWDGLYSQLRIKQEQAVVVTEWGPPPYEDADPVPPPPPPSGSHATLRTHDGRYVYSPSSYLPGFESIAEFGVLIEVPMNPTAGTQGYPAPLLREDANLPLFKLPADLNGDGLVDGNEREGDYRYLPIRAYFVWKDSPTGSDRQIILTTWLRGER